MGWDGDGDKGNAGQPWPAAQQHPKLLPLLVGWKQGAIRQGDGNTTGQGGENDNGEMLQVFFFILIIFSLLIFLFYDDEDNCHSPTPLLRPCHPNYRCEQLLTGWKQGAGGDEETMNAPAPHL
ncbi:hypothetical protein L208DRAFT_816026 [Tricholoma matsutake]|nr:hypothetical protein L208DRAFT_816026 [Tricholoma matsutake 945]